MSFKCTTDNLSKLTNLNDAINLIKFLQISHKAEVTRLQETCDKQNKIIKSLEANRNQELTYLSEQIRKYEADLLEKENTITLNLLEKDKTIVALKTKVEYLEDQIKELSGRSGSIRSDSCDSGIHDDKAEKDKTIVALKTKVEYLEDQIKVPSEKSGSIRSDSCDSGIHDDKAAYSPASSPTPIKKQTKIRRPSFKSIFKNMENSKENDSPNTPKKKIGKFKKFITMWSPKESNMECSEDEGVSITEHCEVKDTCLEQNENEKERIFDRVMGRASVRRLKDAKYLKISRNKSKFLEELKKSYDLEESNCIVHESSS